jgi:hypothetical protein
MALHGLLQGYRYLYIFILYLIVDRAHSTHDRETRNAYKNFVGMPEVKVVFGRSRLRRRDNIKICHKEIGCENVD